MSISLLKFFLKHKHDDNEECDCQPKWLSIALVVLPAVLPVLVEKIADFLMRYFFGNDEKEPMEEEEEEEEEEEV